MNDQLNIERPSGFRNAIYVQMVAMFIFTVTIIWYGARLGASIEARLSTLEQEQSLSHTLIDKLNDAREESRVHGAKVDGQLDNMNGKLSAVLEIVQQDTSAPTQGGGIPNGGPENFQRAPKGRGQSSR